MGANGHATLPRYINTIITLDTQKFTNYRHTTYH